MVYLYMEQTDNLVMQLAKDVVKKAVFLKKKLKKKFSRKRTC